MYAQSKPQPSNPPRLHRLERAFDRFSTHMTQSQKTQSQYRPHILGVDTPGITDTPGTPSYSSALSTRRCHHPSVRCWRRVQDTAVLSHPRPQRGVLRREVRPTVGVEGADVVGAIHVSGWIYVSIGVISSFGVCVHTRERESARDRERRRERERDTYPSQT